MKSIIMVVAALMPELGIGYQGKLPWRLSKEIITFKKITTQCQPLKRNAVIMGRKTWESIPPKFRPLPDRLNIILSRSVQEPSTKDVVYLNDLNKIDTVIDEHIDKVFLIGGAELYNYFFKAGKADKIILTKLTTEKEVEIDTYLDWDLKEWKEKTHEELEEFVGIEIDREFEEKGYKYGYSYYEK